MNEESVGIIPEIRSEKTNPLQSQVFSLGNITTAPEEMIQLESQAVEIRIKEDEDVLSPLGDS